LNAIGVNDEPKKNALDRRNLAVKDSRLVIFRFAFEHSMIDKHSGGRAGQGPTAKLATRWRFSGSGKGSQDSLNAQIFQPSTRNIQ
jgi:hypothetical protein